MHLELFEQTISNYSFVHVELLEQLFVHLKLFEQDVLWQIGGWAQFSGSDSYNSTSFNLTAAHIHFCPVSNLESAKCKP